MTMPMRPRWREARRKQCAFEALVAGPEHGELAAPSSDDPVGDLGDEGSMPFCQVRRLTTQKQRAVVLFEAEALGKRMAGWHCALLERTPARRGEARWVSVSGFQTAVSMPLTMPTRLAGAGIDQAVEAHAEFRRA
jgi:hypothetical protein